MEAGRADRGRLVVVSAPSGTGKSTVCRALVERRDDVAVSISYTTRPPRGDERDGVEYHFVDDATFDAMIAAGAFLEWAPVHDRRYGTARADVEALRASGSDVLFDIDVQGGRQIKGAEPEARLVFILPPSIDELVRRLTDRGTETAAQVAARLGTAVWELEQGAAYDCWLVNDTVERAVAELDALRRAPIDRAQMRDRQRLIEALLAEARRRLAATC